MKPLQNIAVWLLLSFGLMAIGDYAYKQLVLSWNKQSVQAAISGVMERIDGSLNEVVAALDQIAGSGVNDCSNQSLARLNQMIFITGPIKDIALRNGTTSCSAQPQVSLALLVLTGAESGVRSASGSTLLYRISQRDFNGLAVKRMGAKGDVVALLNAGQFLTDAYSLQLPPQTQVTVRLSDGQIAAQSTVVRDVEAGDEQSFSVASAIHPISIDASVPAAALAAWRNKPNPLIYLLGLVASLGISALIAFVLLDPDRPDRRVRRALAAREIKPFLQPIFDIASARIVGYEVLARWQLPDGRIQGPAAFIDEVEKHGLSDRLFHTMCQQVGDGLATFAVCNPDLRIAFNVTPEQIETPGFAETARSAIGRSGLPFTSVTLEVTERQAISNHEQVHHNLAWLRAEGVHVAVDDAGTGHNGLSALATLAPDVVKIDKYFVDGMEKNERALAVISMLVQAARDMRMKTVAEGVETDIQLERLRRAGVDSAQGFYMARPMPLSWVEEFHQSHETRLLRALSATARLQETPAAKAEPETGNVRRARAELALAH